MPRVHPSRDDSLAQSGYLRVKIIAGLLNLTPSAVSRWTDGVDVRSVRAGGLCWVLWKDVCKLRAAEIQNMKPPLPSSAVDALAFARKKLKSTPA